MDREEPEREINRAKSPHGPLMSSWVLSCLSNNKLASFMQITKATIMGTIQRQHRRFYTGNIPGMQQILDLFNTEYRPGVVFQQILYKAPKRHTERVITIKAMMTGKRMPVTCNTENIF